MQNENLRKGYVVRSKNFKLKRKIKSLEEFWKTIRSETSIFGKHRVYPAAFFLNWPIKTIVEWINNGWFWTIKINKCDP